MNKILLLLVACILSVSTCHKKVSTVVDGTMIAVEDTLTKPQLDSVFIADELSFDIENNWIPFCVLTEDKRDSIRSSLSSMVMVRHPPFRRTVIHSNIFVSLFL